EALALGDSVAGGDKEAGDETRHRGFEGRRTGGSGRGFGHLSDRAAAFVDGVDREAVAVEFERVLACASAWADCDAVDGVAYAEEPEWAAWDRLDGDRVARGVLGYAIRGDFDRVARAVDVYRVLHRVSSTTVST